MSFFDAISGAVSKAADVVASTASAIADGVTNVVNKARDAANKAVDWMLDKAKQVGEAISKAAAWVFDKAKQAFSAAKAAAVKIVCKVNQAVIAAKKAMGSGDPIYDTPEEAAKAALTKANPQSILQGTFGLAQVNAAAVSTPNSSSISASSGNSAPH